MDGPSPLPFRTTDSSLGGETVELDLTPNGDEIKVRWKISGPQFSKTIRIPAPNLKKRSEEVRDELKALNTYVQEKNLDQQRDPGWRSYSAVITRLQQAGQGLASALFPSNNPVAQEKAAALRNLPAGTPMLVHCSDSEVSLPLGFLFRGDIGAIRPPTGQPSLAHFADFWLSRFEITMLVDGSGCKRFVVDPMNFKALYALHETELGNAAQWLGADRDKLSRLLTIPVKAHYDWQSAVQAWKTIRDDDNVVFVLAHSDGDWLHLSDISRLDSNTLLDAFEKSDSKATLLILNCCLSASGGEGISLLSVIARPGFCGLVGTEAEILNTYALRCGTRLMWELCAKGSTLGEAFDAMQGDMSLFPLNLFYTCYADRRFRLDRPLHALNQNSGGHDTKIA
jgi:hypothetical protein